MQGETIAAIATASGSGSISIIRVSGPEALCCVDRVFSRAGAGAFLSEVPSHTIHYGWIGRSDEELIDEVLVLVMRAPRSYTAEDVVEIHCHGGGQAAGSILSLLLENGVRLAEPGEFTKRAFLNGRIDLTQAEAVMEIIRAKSDLALTTAESHLRGDVRDRVRAMRQLILDDTAYLEAALDDPEHIEMEDYPATLRAHLKPIEEEIDLLLKRAENGRLISEGIRTAIIGRPNVGKSSFLNCILREDRAIVTDVPGTTRDTLEEEVRIGRILLRLIDTAGIRSTLDPVESIGVEKAMHAQGEADFIILVLDASESLADEDRRLLSDTWDRPGVVLLNKSDLIAVVTAEDVREIVGSSLDSEVDGSVGSDFPGGEAGNHSSVSKTILEFSAKTGEGLAELETLLEKLFLSELYQNCHEKNAEPVITGQRQKQALIETRESIRRLYETLDAGMPEDLLTVDLMSAYEALGRITGETIEDDLADKIFAEFCMGK